VIRVKAILDANQWSRPMAIGSQIPAKRHTLINALRIAASQYAADAHTCSCTPGHDRMAMDFKAQAGEALGLADQIEQSDTIRLED
jgi:hypothetical protein